MADEATALAEAKKLPFADRIAHANWKVRSAAFDEINVACNGVYDENDPCLQEFGEEAHSASISFPSRLPTLSVSAHHLRYDVPSSLLQRPYSQRQFRTQTQLRKTKPWMPWLPFKPKLQSSMLQGMGTQEWWSVKRAPS